MAERMVTAAEFAAGCRELLDEVAAGGGAIVITIDGQPAARLAPCREGPGLLGQDLGRIEILGDIMAPLDVEWEAEVNPERVIDPITWFGRPVESEQ